MPGGFQQQVCLSMRNLFVTSCRFVQVCVTFLLPPGINGLMHRSQGGQKYGSRIFLEHFFVV